MPHPTTLLALLSLVLLPTAHAAPTPKAGIATEAPVSGLIIALSRPGQMNAGSSTSATLTNLSTLAGVRLRHERTLSNGASLLSLPRPTTGAEARAITARLSTSPQVLHASPDYQRRVAATPNDPGFSDQWHLFAPTASFNDISTVGGINMPSAWDIVTGSTGTVIAILDTGLLPHAEITGQVLPGHDFVSNTFVANDGNGRDSNPADPGDWVTISELDRPECTGDVAHDSTWHGTFVAGIAAATGNNSSGISGVNWNTRILPVRVLGKCGGADSDIIDGMRWAAGLPVAGIPTNPYPADVINLSLGGFSECTAAWRSAIAEIQAAGVTIVASSGNDSAAAVTVPAACPEVIAVTAHTIEGINAFYANIGPEIAVSAPGGGQATGTDGGAIGSGLAILSLSNTGTTSALADSLTTSIGTSHATPQVAGVVALLRTLAPAMHPRTIRSLIQVGARPHPAGTYCTLAEFSGMCGTGLLDATNTLANASAALAGNTPPVVSAPLSVAGREGTSLTFQITGTDADGDSLFFGAVAGTLPGGAAIGTTSGLFTWSTPVAGTHRLQVIANDGLSSSASQEVTVTVTAGAITDIPSFNTASSSRGKGGGSTDLILLILAAASLLLRCRKHV